MNAITNNLLNNFNREGVTREKAYSFGQEMKLPKPKFCPLKTVLGSFADQQKLRNKPSFFGRQIK